MSKAKRVAPSKADRDFHLTCLSSALRQEGYRVSHGGKPGLKIITAGWQYRLNLSETGCRIDPPNTSQSYQKLCDSVRRHLLRIAAESESHSIPLTADLPWRSLVLWEPWATLIANRLTTWETRPRTISWHGYRGVLLIQAAKTWHPEGLEFLNLLKERGRELKLSDFSPGHVVALTHMTKSVWTEIAPTVSEDDLLMGNWEPDRWAIQLQQIQALPRPIPASGGQGLRRVPAAIQQQVLEQLQAQTAVSDVTNALDQ